MSDSTPTSPWPPLLATLAMLILLGLNLAVSEACRGRYWSVFAVLPLAAAQAALLVFILMELPAEGSVPRVYLGLAVILLGVAALSLADYATRTSALEGEPGPGAASAGTGYPSGPSIEGTGAGVGALDTLSPFGGGSDSSGPAGGPGAEPAP